MSSRSRIINHLPPLISDLAIILATAGMVSILFKRIGQPVVLGYLLAGFLVSPEISILPAIQEKEAIKIWAEIGVIFLLFGLGLEFSFKKLMSVGRGAAVTATFEILSMLGVGYLIGQILGWQTMDSLFLGGILAISSTTIIIRAIDELGYNRRGFVNLVFGVLIIEDVAAVLLIVLLSTIAVSQTFEGLALAMSAARLVFFLTLWFLGGILIVPWILRKIRPLMNDETYLVFSLGLCFLMVVLATKAGFSPALGAFIMGSVLAETPDGERINHGLTPVKNLFAAIFFVSVGMLIELDVLAEYWPVIIVISLAHILGKFISATLGSILSGQSLRHSVQVGASLTQIGEFSFIIATLGMTLKVTSDFLYPVAVSVSALTTFTTPHVIRNSDRLHKWIVRRIPPQWRAQLEAGMVQPAEAQRYKFRQGSFPRVFVNSMVVIAIALTSANWVQPLVEARLGENGLSTYGMLGLSILVALPFLWAIISNPRDWQYKPEGQEDVKKYTKQMLLTLLLRSLLAIFLLGFMVVQFTSAILSLLLVGALAVGLGLLGYGNFRKIYNWLERSFLSHLDERELRQMKSERPRPALAPWDAHLAEFLVHPDSNVVGKNLLELAFKENFGVTVAMIERGSRLILAPKRETLVMAHDKVLVIGTDDQLERFSRVFEPETLESLSVQSKNYGLSQIELGSGSPFASKSIRDCGIREAADGLIVGVERNGQRILNPDSGLVLQEKDLLWIVGNNNLVSALVQKPS